MLTNLGYTAEVAANGLEALEALSHNDYAIVFMDCQMPELDGHEATRRLRQQEAAAREGGSNRHTCVIAFTASAMAADHARCLESGMDDYLTKPVKTENLAAKLVNGYLTTSPGIGPII